MNREFLIKELTSSNIEYNYNYVCKYVDFCLSRNDELKTPHHKHHILPKGIPKYKKYKNINENVWNCSHLTVREHFIAHKMLSKALPKNLTAVLAFSFMSMYLKESINSKEYELIQIKKSKLQKESRAINKNGEIRFVHQDECDYYLNNGWKYGYGRKYIHMNKRNTQKNILVDDVDEYLESGWKIGSLKKGNYSHIHKIKSGKFFKKVIKNENLDEYLNCGWVLGNGISYDKGTILIYKVDEEFYDTKKVKLDDLESYIQKGYLFGVPREIRDSDCSMYMDIDGIKTKILVNQKYVDCLVNLGWNIDEIDMIHKKFILTDFYKPEKKKIRKYLETINDKKFIKASYLISCKKRTERNNIWINNGKFKMQIFSEDAFEYTKNGWKIGLNINPHLNKVIIHKKVNGKIINKTIDSCDYQYYTNDGWVDGTGKSNVTGRKHIHNPVTNEHKMVEISDIDNYLKQGWLKGRSNIKKKI